jgi:aspartyl-tRNA(Asn)/glutamyl-tRNA(Gln) amidotransferase subunit A
VPLDGVVPLSSSLDSLGPLGASVSCCAIVDAVLAGETPRPPQPRPVAGLRFAIPEEIVRDGMDAVVSAAFDAALDRLEQAGARIAEVSFAPLAEIGPAHRKASFPAAEAYAWHRDLLAAQGDRYDPRVRARLLFGETIAAADYIDLLAARRRIAAAMAALTVGYDALLMPTVPIVAPRLDEIAADADFMRLNALMLRNPSLANFLDRCAISLPCHAPGDPPVGLTLMGETGGDAALFAIAAGVEALLRA